MWVDSLNGGNNKKKKNKQCRSNEYSHFISSDSPKVFAIGSSISCELLLDVLSQWTETPFTWPHFPVSGGLSYYFINRNVISWLQWPQTKEQNNCTQPRPTSPFWEKQELFLCSAITHEFSPWIFHVIVSIEQFLFQLVRWSNMNLSCFVNQFNLVLLILLSLLFPF